MKTFDWHRFFSYEIAIAALALSFCMSALSSSLSELFHFQYSSLYTAASLYLPVLFSLGIFLAANHKTGAPLLDVRGLTLLLFLCGFWLINYLHEIGRVPSGSLSDYDTKRIWFFVQGVLLSGLIGLHAPRDSKHFIRYLLISFCVISAVSSLSYLLTYRPGERFVRLLGERALGSGQVASFGAGSCLALLLLHVDGSRRLPGRLLAALVGAIFVHAAAIALSATRGAALSALASLIAFVWMTRRSKALPATLGFLILLFIGLVIFAKVYMPEATLRRLTTKQQGLEIRYELNRTMLNMIMEHPCGRVLGYGNTKLSMDYSHNALLQCVGEAGLVQAGPVLLVLFWGVLRNIWRRRADPYLCAFGLFALPILIESFSAGSAYSSALWFLVFFFYCARAGPQPAIQGHAGKIAIHAPKRPEAEGPWRRQTLHATPYSIEG